jgi:ureidoacrylate peracid hydrolase
VVPSVTLDPEHCALIVIDMQNDYAHPDGYYATRGQPSEAVRATYEANRTVLDAARQSGTFVVFVTVIMREAGFPDVPDIHAIQPEHFAGIGRRLEKGTWGAQVVDELAPLPHEVVMEKHTYSVFYQTDLELMLRRRGISTVILTGTATHACVLHAAFDAWVRDFDVIVVRDGVSTFFPEVHESSLRIVELQLGAVLSASEVTSLLEAPALATATT